MSVRRSASGDGISPESARRWKTNESISVRGHCDATTGTGNFIRGKNEKMHHMAFELKDVDMHQVFADAGFPVSKPELSALFRQPGHKNFRLCGDQLLRNFLKGLTLRVRGS